VVFDTGDAREQVNSPRGQAQLDDGARTKQIVPSDPQCFDRRAELAQRPPCTSRVLLRALNPDIEVSGGSRDAVDRHRVRPNDEETHTGAVQADQQVAEIVVQSGERTPAGRTTRTDIRSRG